MIPNGEIRGAIEKYQKEHPPHFGQMIDVTAIDSKEGADIISQAIEQVAKKVDEDIELWCICEMAKKYMQGVKPVYPVRLQGEWEFDSEHTEFGNPYGTYKCSRCGGHSSDKYPYCFWCGAEMKGGNK